MRIIILFCILYFEIFSLPGLTQTSTGGLPSFSQSGENLCKSFNNLNRPEKCWAVSHPFVAKRAWKITFHTKEIVAGLKNDSLLDGDLTGGQADAFRHAYWMASLCKEIHWRKALKLGNAHEKGNIIDFKKGKPEDGIIQDKASVEMDLFNNQYGILIGKQYKKIPENEMIEMVKHAVLRGELKVIKKDINGNSLDENDQIISDWIGKWENRRVLVSSDFIQPP